MRHSRIEKELALVLIVAIVVAMVGCKKKKAGDEADLSSILSSETETAPEETTTETTEVTATTESTAALETSEATPSETSEPTESTEPSETTLDPTATPTDTPADPTPTSPPTNTPTSTSTPTPIPATATPTNTPAPTPTTAPARTKDAKDYMDSARSAVRQAIVDKCGWKTGFEFNDNIMANEKARAKYSINNDYFGHGEISGTVIPLEACGGIGCTYLPDTDQLQWYWTDYSGTDHYYKKRKWIILN